jgi:hypothetical protein
MIIAEEEVDGLASSVAEDMFRINVLVEEEVLIGMVADGRPSSDRC